jgi:DNA-directed RNA polymerase specialized sigma24 family protein
MSYNKILIGAGSVLALTLALAQPSLANPETTNAPEATPAVTEPAPAVAEPAAVAPAVEPAAAAAPPAPPPAASLPAVLPEPPVAPEPPALPPELAARQAEHERLLAMTPEERWEARRAELNQRYADLRQRAAEAGMELPDQAPWERNPPAAAEQPPRPPAWGPGKGPGRMLMSPEERQAIREKMRSMSPEERHAFHKQHYQEMRERAAAQGIELPEQPPWARAEGEPPAAPQPPMTADAPDTTHWARLKEVLNSMSPEQLEACMMMHRLPGPMAMPRYPGPAAGGYGYGPGPGYGRGAGAPPGWQPWGGYGQ